MTAVNICTYFIYNEFYSINVTFFIKLEQAAFLATSLKLVCIDIFYTFMLFSVTIAPTIGQISKQIPQSIQSIESIQYCALLFKFGSESILIQAVGQISTQQLQSD